MSTAEAGTFSLDIEANEWFIVPAVPADSIGWRSAVTAILELLAEVEQQLVDEGDLPDTGVVDIEAALDTLLEFSSALDDGLVLVAGLGVPGAWPLPVVVSVSDSGAEGHDLLEAAGARGGLPVDPPTVDHLPAELGDGIRVTRIDLDDEAALWATVSCARRSGDVDVVLTWRTARLELVPQFSPLLEQLLTRVKIGSDA